MRRARAVRGRMPPHEMLITSLHVARVVPAPSPCSTGRKMLYRMRNLHRHAERMTSLVYRDSRQFSL
jgi:hypothetical protein